MIRFRQWKGNIPKRKKKTTSPGMRRKEADMKLLRTIFEKLNNRGLHCFCGCGHSVSANLPFCPFCGRRINDGSSFPMDWSKKTMIVKTEYIEMSHFLIFLWKQLLCSHCTEAAQPEPLSWPLWTRDILGPPQWGGISDRIEAKRVMQIWSTVSIPVPGIRGLTLGCCLLLRGLNK